MACSLAPMVACGLAPTMAHCLVQLTACCLACCLAPMVYLLGSDGVSAWFIPPRRAAWLLLPRCAAWPNCLQISANQKPWTWFWAQNKWFGPCPWWAIYCCAIQCNESNTIRRGTLCLLVVSFHRLRTQIIEVNAMSRKGMGRPRSHKQIHLCETSTNRASTRGLISAQWGYNARVSPAMHIDD